MREAANSPGFWPTVALLLGSARRRSIARAERGRQLLQQKSGRDATNWGSLGKAVPIIFMLVLNGIGAILLPVAVKSAQRVAAEQSGRIVVSNWFFDAVRAKEAFNRSPHESRVCHDLNGETYCYDSVGQPVNQLDYEREARAIAEDEGGSRPEVEQKLREALEKRGASAFISKKDAVRGTDAGAR